LHGVDADAGKETAMSLRAWAIKMRKVSEAGRRFRGLYETNCTGPGGQFLSAAGFDSFTPQAPADLRHAARAQTLYRHKIHTRDPQPAKSLSNAPILAIDRPSREAAALHEKIHERGAAEHSLSGFPLG
jgi:hypothetical protein